MIMAASFSCRTDMPTQPVKIINICGLWLRLPALILAIAVTLPAYAAPQVVGHISFVKGSNAAQQPGAAPRILGKDTEIFQGDNIQTTERSFVIIEFTDGAKVTVRPDSNFTIDHYDSQSANKTAQLVLHEGAVNASTGDIAKGNPENFQINTPTATIKPQSEKAEFAVDICDQACEDKAKKAAANAPITEESIVARVVDLKGQVNAKNRNDKNAKERPLSLGKPLFNSDTIYSEKDSYALLVFPDGEKVTLEADSEMEIKQYHYQIKDKKDKVLLKLAVGGLRALTGSIGKKDHDAFALDTPVATIGIRGTGTDSYFDGTSLDHSTWEGTSFVKNEAGEFDVPEGSSSITSNSKQAPRVFKTPQNVVKPDSPRPDKDKSDPKKVREEKTPSKGDTSVKAIRGNVTTQSNDDNDGKKNTKTVKEGTDSNEAPLTNSDNNPSDDDQSGTSDGKPGTGGTSNPDNDGC